MSDGQSENSPHPASLYGPDGKPITSNEPAAEPSEKRSWLARQLPTRNERLALAIGLAIAFGFAGYNYWNDNKDDNR